MNIEPWIDYLKHTHTGWFREVFKLIHANGFKLTKETARHLEDGGSITFQRGESLISLSRYYPYTYMGDRPGVCLQNCAEEFEIDLTVYTPIEIIEATIKSLIDNE